MDKDYIEDLLSDTGVKCKFTNFKWIADLTFDIEPDTIGLEGYRLVSNDYGTKITASDTKGLFYGLQTFKPVFFTNFTLSTKKKGDIFTLYCGK